jgi:hypothetical protein
MSDIPKKFSDREQGKADVEFTNDIRKLGIFGFIKTDKGMVPLTRAQVNRRKKRRRYG